MIEKKDKQRIYLYSAFTFGIAWATALIIYLTGGLTNSPIYSIGGLQINLATILLATIYMFSPAIANFLTRLITKEGKANLKLRMNLKQGRWRFFLATWLLPGGLTLSGTTLFFLIFPPFLRSLAIYPDGTAFIVGKR